MGKKYPIKRLQINHTIQKNIIEESSLRDPRRNNLL
jgi:hypothetical protein